MPAIDPGPNLPTRKQQGFSDSFSAWLIWFTTTFITQFNAAIAALNLNSVQSTSTSSVVIGTGPKTLITQTGKSYSPGMFIIVAETANAATNYMYGQVTTYVSGSGSLSFTVPSGQAFGSGTLSAWSITQAPPGGATNTFVQQTIQNQSATAFTTTGTSTALLGAPSPAYSAVANFQKVIPSLHVALNGSAVTFQLAGQAALSLVNPDGSNPVAPLGYKAEFENDGAKWIFKNPPVETTLVNFTANSASNILTFTVQPSFLKFRSATLNSGLPQLVASALATLAAPVGATFGAPAAITSASATVVAGASATMTLVAAPSAPVQVGAIVFLTSSGARIGKVQSLATYVGGVGTGTIVLDNAAISITTQAIIIINPVWLVGVMMANGEIAVINQAGAFGVNKLDETGLISTTAISAGATSATTFYSTTTRTNQPYKVIFMAQVAQATVGTNAIQPEQVFSISGSGYAAMMSAGVGQSNQDTTSQRVVGQTYRNIENKPISVTGTISGSTGATNILTVNGINIHSSSIAAAGTWNNFVTGIVPPGHTFAYTGNTALASATELR
jgi:hypothetical protein